MANALVNSLQPAGELDGQKERSDTGSDANTSDGEASEVNESDAPASEDESGDES